MVIDIDIRRYTALQVMPIVRTRPVVVASSDNDQTNFLVVSAIA